SQNIGASGKKYNLPTENDGVCEILLTLDARNAAQMTLSLSNARGEHVDMAFDPTSQTFTFDRTESGVTDFSQDFPAVVWAPTLRDSSVQQLRIFIDRSSIEIFDGEGSFVMTNLVFPTDPYNTLTVRSQGGNGQVKDLEIFTINLKK
ncbi:MAG: GH32 C-terminal domain-containing protein, partial [Muribaculaceae bacterium]|nr:GH32 C-terminal domain-containing protein [Muribaculaceae bacterium]